MIKKILFIRRDNIGDLICTTPAIHAVRQKYPNAKIGILVNSYNAEVVKNNPDVDEIYVYEKAKHVPEKNKISVWWNNFKILMKIRKEKYDVAIACGSYSPRLARYTYMTGSVIRIGYLPKGIEKSTSYNMPLHEPKEPMHEVERVFNLLSPLGIDGIPDKLRVFPSQTEIQKVKELLNERRFFAAPSHLLRASAQNDIKEVQNETKVKNKVLIAFHISSRKPENRWSADNFIKLAKLITNKYDAKILLLWSPGSEKNPYHPGDDEKAEFMLKSLPQLIPYKTKKLSELIAALSFVDFVVCLDGGAMHIASALGKPIVTVWGSTDQSRWKPWGIKHIILQDGTKKADSIKPEQVFEAVEKLLKEFSQ